MDIQNHTESCEVRMAYSLFHVPVTDSVVAYKLGRGPLPGQVLPQQLADKLHLVVEEGLTSRHQITEYLGGRSTGIKPTEHLYLAHPDLRAAIRELGFSDGFRLLNDKKLEPLSRVPFTDLTERGASASNLLRVDYSADMLFSLEGDSLPVAVHCDYISARMNDGAYHLEKAAEILVKDSRVRFVDDRRRQLTGAKNVVQNVPYYNSRPGSSRYLHFWFMPTEDDAKRLWEKQLSYGTKYPSTEEHRAMFDLDILGLRAGGAAKYDEFYKSDEDLGQGASDDHNDD